MKIQIDTISKIISVEENVNLGDLVKHLEGLLPKTHPLGHWKLFTLQTNTTIFNWSNPIYIPSYPTYPTYPTWFSVPMTSTDITVTDVGIATNTTYCFELN